MIPEYLELVARIEQELQELEVVVARAERGIQAARQRLEDQDLYISHKNGDVINVKVNL